MKELGPVHAAMFYLNGKVFFCCHFGLLFTQQWRFRGMKTGSGVEKCENVVSTLIVFLPYERLKTSMLWKLSAHSHLTKKKQDLQGNRSGLAAPTVTTWLFNASIFVVGSMTAKPCLQKHRWRILHYTWCFVCSFKAKTKRANSTRYSGSGEICLECFFGRWMMNLMKVVPKFLNSQLCYVLMSVFCMFENVL